MNRSEINQKQKQFIYPAISNYFTDPPPLDHDEMQHVWDVEGKRYLDFYGGIVKVGVGHANLRVTGPMKAQVNKLQHSFPLYRKDRADDFWPSGKSFFPLQRQRGQPIET